MTSIKWLLIFLMIPACVLAESQAASGTFVLNTTAQMVDTWLNELAGGPQAVNYGSDTFVVIGDEPGLGTEERALFRGTLLPDSMFGRNAIAATLNLVVLSEAIAAAAQIVVHALEASAAVWIEVSDVTVKGACWDFARYTEATDTMWWASEGCKTSGTDFSATTLDSVDITSVAVGDTISLDITAAVNAGIKNFIVYMGNCSNANGINVFSSEAVSKQSFISVNWIENEEISPVCDNGQFAVPTGIGIYDVTAARMKTFDATLDSMSVRMLGVDNDTLFGLCYKNFDADSGLLEVGETLVVTTGATCEDVMLQFSGTTLLKADSSYFFGVQHKPISQDAYSFCVTYRAADTSYYGTAYPNPIAGVKTTNGYSAVCFTAYLTEDEAPTDSGGRMLIISSCWSDETPHYDGQSWSNIQ